MQGQDVAKRLARLAPADGEHVEPPRHAAVRALLDCEPVRTALQEPGGRRDHLDNADIRLASAVGRDIIQACTLAFCDRPDQAAVITAARTATPNTPGPSTTHRVVAIAQAIEFSPDIAGRPAAVRSVADLWDLPSHPHDECPVTASPARTSPEFRLTRARGPPSDGSSRVGIEPTREELCPTTTRYLYESLDRGEFQQLVSELPANPDAWVAGAPREFKWSFTDMLGG